MSKLRPLADKIVVERIESVAKTAGGIVIPDTAKEKPEQGKVISVGKDVKEVKEGNEVLFGKYSPTEVKIDSREYLLIKEEDVLAIVG